MTSSSCEGTLPTLQSMLGLIQSITGLPVELWSIPNRPEYQWNSIRVFDETTSVSAFGIYPNLDTDTLRQQPRIAIEISENFWTAPEDIRSAFSLAIGQYLSFIAITDELDGTSDWSEEREYDIRFHSQSLKHTGVNTIAKLIINYAHSLSMLEKYFPSLWAYASEGFQHGIGHFSITDGSEITEGEEFLQELIDYSLDSVQVFSEHDTSLPREISQKIDSIMSMASLLPSLAYKSLVELLQEFFSIDESVTIHNWQLNQPGYEKKGITLSENNPAIYTWSGEEERAHNQGFLSGYMKPINQHDEFIHAIKQHVVQSIGNQSPQWVTEKASGAINLPEVIKPVIDPGKAFKKIENNIPDTQEITVLLDVQQEMIAWTEDNEYHS